MPHFLFIEVKEGGIILRGAHLFVKMKEGQPRAHHLGGPTGLATFEMNCHCLPILPDEMSVA